MSSYKTLWRHNKWHEFSVQVKQRDGHCCIHCGRGEPSVVLQVHHLQYKENRLPWEYSLEDCVTVCRGCHAREHGIIEPNSGWSLVGIHDLGGLDGHCERSGCNSSIRYEHITYHPSWGYKVVGSTCIQHLTQDDRRLSGEILHMYLSSGKFVMKSDWHRAFTKQKRSYIQTTHQHHYIRIYGEEGRYAFQLAMKKHGKRWHEYGDFHALPGKSLDDVKRLSYIALKGTMSCSERDKQTLRELYKSISCS